MLRQTRMDLLIGVPFVLVFAIPIVGYTAPLFAYFAPRYIPSTFQTPSHLTAFLKTDSKASKEGLKALGEVYAYHGSACGLEKMREMIKRIEKGQGKVGALTELYPLATIMQELTPDPRMLSRGHLLHLNAANHHSGFIARYLYTRSMLVTSLTNWRAQTLKDDQLLSVHGVSRLSTEQLAAALYARGIYRHPASMAAVLSHAQERALNEADSPPGTTSSLESKSTNPTPEMIADWRRTLQEWIDLHLRLARDAEAHHKRLLAEAAEADTSTTATGTDVDSNASSSSSPTPRKPVPAASTLLPATFLLHLPALARVAQTQPSSSEPTSTAHQKSATIPKKQHDSNPTQVAHAG